MSGTRPRTNRLSRSGRQSQAAEKSSSAGDESAQTPGRRGKRGRRVVGSVTISDIVNRIAPETGRPRVLEPLLLQWIRDTVPCTPEIQEHRGQRRSPRQNGADDLLRLARQFDFNLLHETRTDQDPDPDPAQNPAQNPGPDWISDEDLDFLFDGPTQGASGAFSPDFTTPNVPQNCSERHFKTPDDFRSKPAVNAELRESPASSSSKNLSHTPLRRSAPKPEKLNSQNKSFKFKALSNTKITSPVPNCDFDDWADDDLMDDSLLLELTQNPFGFLTPNSTSTQKNSGKADGPIQTFALTANTNLRPDADGDFRKPTEQTDFNVGTCGNLQWKTDAIYPNSTTQQNKTSQTRLKENSHRNVGSKWSDAQQPAGFSSPQNAYRSKRAQNVSKYSLQVSQSDSSTSKRTGGVHSGTGHRSGDVRATAASRDTNDFRKTLHGLHSNSAIKSHSKPEFQSGEKARATESAPSNPDHAFGDDLDAIFSSDPIWDDAEDDDLLCELCEDVENQMLQKYDQSEPEDGGNDQSEPEDGGNGQSEPEDGGNGQSEPEVWTGEQPEAADGKNSSGDQSGAENRAYSQSQGCIRSGGGSLGQSGEQRWTENQSDATHRTGSQSDVE